MSVTPKPTKVIPTPVPAAANTTEENSLDDFEQQIAEEFGDSNMVWKNINLYRKNPITKTFEFLDSFEVFPSPVLPTVKNKWGGGDYRLFLQYNIGDIRNKLNNKFFTIAGPSIQPKVIIENPAAPVAAVPPAGNGMIAGGYAPVNPADPFAMLERTISLVKTMMPAAAPAASSDMTSMATIMSKSMETQTTMLTAVITAISGMVSKGQATPSEGNTLTEIVVKALIGKTGTSELDQALKIVDTINDRAAATGPREENIGDTITKVMAGLPALGAMMNPNGAGLGLPPGGIAGLLQPPANGIGAPAAPNMLEGIMSEIRGGFTALGARIDVIDSRLKEVEEDYWDKDDIPAGKAADTNVIDLQQPGEQVVDAEPIPPPVVMTPEQEAGEFAEAKRLFEAPDAAKIGIVTLYLNSYPVDAIYNWYIKFGPEGAEKNAIEFNRVLKLMGKEEFHPGLVEQTPVVS